MTLWKPQTCRCVIELETNSLVKPCPYHTTVEEVLAVVNKAKEVQALYHAELEKELGTTKYYIQEARVKDGVEQIISTTEIDPPSIDKGIAIEVKGSDEVEYTAYGLSEQEIAILGKVDFKAPIKKEDGTELKKDAGEVIKGG